MTRAENNSTDQNSPERTKAEGANSSPGRPKEASPEVTQFIAQLAQEEKMLVVLQRELYEESWQAMLADLRNRLDGKPYIFKLANRIRDDIARIERLKAFEEQHGVKLADYIEPPSG